MALYLNQRPVILVYEKCGLKRLLVLKVEKGDLQIIKVVKHYHLGEMNLSLVHRNGIWSID